MATDDEYALYEQAWGLLSDLVQQRAELLRELERMAATASQITIITSLVVEFGVERAGILLDQIADLTPQIAAGILRVNRHARKIGKPDVRWIKLGMREN